MRVICVNTGLANIASVRQAFERLGVSLVDARDVQDIVNADALVMPGVGAFGPAMRSLQQRKLVTPLRDVILGGRPLLAVCLGLQLLCEGSEEGTGEAGLGIVPGVVRRLREREADRVRVPHMGWNRITPTRGAKLLGEDFMYFAHSFALSHVPPEWEAATVTHGQSFVAAIERGNVLACQFHPELSGRAGAQLLARWIDAARTCACAGGASC
jgi:imidazole glycerol phosphate synthase glutamine amidotransferase subunit